MKNLVCMVLAVMFLTQDAFASTFRRVALVVGANAAAPGRKRLRFAHQDARNVADVLRVGGFYADDIHMLHDPNPGEVLSKLDEVLTVLATSPARSLLFFYYSGHADAQALYPNGKSLELTELRSRLDSEHATVRVGIIDACRGGGWTGTKGLSETEVFSVRLPLELSNEGSVLISSSSGLEDAHESESLRGSFFTHHWNAALRGAGDDDQDGIVTLGEAFEYAKRLTIRDTALHTNTPQHPSFQINLRGRRDLELVNLSAGDSLISVEQHRGPLQLIHLETGLVILEIPKGKRTLKLAVPRGRYLVRRQQGSKILAREVVVEVGAVARLSEEQLELVGTKQLVAKSFVRRPVTYSTVPAGMWDVRFALGVRHGPSLWNGLEYGDGAGPAGTFGLTRGITGRLQWVVPTLGFAYRAGTEGGQEWIPWGGLTSWGVGYASPLGFVLQGTLGLGMDTRFWTDSSSSVNLGLGFSSLFTYDQAFKWSGLTTWRSQATVGYSRTIGDTVTLNAGLAVSQNLLYRGDVPEFGGSRGSHDPVLSIGSVQNRALRSLPLLQLHLSDRFTLDGHAFVSYSLDSDKFADTYMFGATWIW